MTSDPFEKVEEISENSAENKKTQHVEISSGKLNPEIDSSSEQSSEPEAKMNLQMVLAFLVRFPFSKC